MYMCDIATNAHACVCYHHLTPPFTTTAATKLREFYDAKVRNAKHSPYDNRCFLLHPFLLHFSSFSSFFSALLPALFSFVAPSHITQQQFVLTLFREIEIRSFFLPTWPSLTLLPLSLFVHIFAIAAGPYHHQPVVMPPWMMGRGNRSKTLVETER